MRAAPTGRLKVKFDFENFYGNPQEYPIWVTMGRKDRVLYMKTLLSMFYCSRGNSITIKSALFDWNSVSGCQDNQVGINIMRTRNNGMLQVHLCTQSALLPLLLQGWLKASILFTVQLTQLFSYRVIIDVRFDLVIVISTHFLTFLSSSFTSAFYRFSVI